MSTVRPATSTAPAVLALTAVALGALLAAPAVSPAAASLGSVPDEVEVYVEDGALVERLIDLYGPDASGERGIDFDDTTETGDIARVFAWADAVLAGEETEEPVRLLNEWIVPVLIDEAPVGLATVWINPDTVLPELAVFDPDPALAEALAEIPGKAALVRDEGAGAWFALEEGVITPLVPGRSGLETPAPLADVAIIPPGSAETDAGVSTDGLPIAIAALVLLVLVIVATLLIPERIRAARERTASSGDSAPS